jgi:prepilin-type N-terminal cleavage/methylation domain-containing protein
VFSSYRNIMARKAAGEMDETGFTLIELLIVIVVLGILAGVVIFALGGVTGQSAIAACKADGATVSTALAAFNTDNPSLTATASQTDLLPGATGVTGGPFLQSWPSNGSHYAYSLTSAGVLDIAINGSTASPPVFTGAVPYTGANMAAGGCDNVT